jgi:hypothetical protein
LKRTPNVVSSPFFNPEIGAEKLSESLRYPDVDTYYESRDKQQKIPEFRLTPQYAEKGYIEPVEV